MTEIRTAIRAARPGDEEGIVSVHDLSWAEAYLGVIPGYELLRMIARRRSDWWAKAIRIRTPLLVAVADEQILGYCSYGRNRVPAMQFGGEVFELYVHPECYGAGLGTRLFEAAQADLSNHGFNSAVAWALDDNIRATQFLESRGGIVVFRRNERFGDKILPRRAFGFSESGRLGDRSPKERR